MADSAWGSMQAADPPRAADVPRHSASVRVTHWIAALCFSALLVTGVEIVISHPRFYWGDEGNVLTEPLFTLPIPASRGSVPTGYDFVLPDQNGWSRSLHFQTAWILVFAGLFYVIAGTLAAHFPRNLLPAGADLRWEALRAAILSHLRFRAPDPAEAWSYNTLQRLSYLAVVFVLFPVMIWTGLAMSPTVTSAFPWIVDVLGGHQSARTIHFLCTILLVLFSAVHVMMVYLAGFTSRVRAMVTGRADAPKELS